MCAQRTRRAFTLIELLLVMGIIGGLSAVVITAVNPGRQLAEARNAQRHSDVTTLLHALQQYTVENGSNVAGIDATVRMIGTATAGCAVPCPSGGGVIGTPSGAGAYWSLDQVSGTILDGSGNGKNSTVQSGVTYGVAGKAGTALRFDGNDYVDFPAVFPHDGDPRASIDALTVEAWFRASAPPAATAVIAWEGWGGSFVLQMNTTGGIGFQVKQTRSGGTHYDGAWHGLNANPATFSDGQWHHAVGRYDRPANTVQLTIDGVLRGTYTAMNPAEYLSDPPTNHPPILGASSVYTGARQQFFIGDIDEVAVYARVLSDAEILQRFQGGATTADGCLDLSATLAPSYVAVIPSDPRSGDSARTFYAVTSVGNGRTEVRACDAELGEDIRAQQ